MDQPSPTPTLKVLWRPNPGRQTAFLASGAHEVLWGGEAGGGKSGALIALALGWCHNGNFRGLILRREGVDLRKLLDNAEKLYPFAFPGAELNRTEKVWYFPSGAQIRFSHCEHEHDAFGYQGDEFHFIGWDELTQFTEGQYAEINTRLRTTDATLPTISRATANPGGLHAAWVFRRFAAWLDPEAHIDGLPPRPRLPSAREGQVLHFRRAGETGERVVAPGDPLARSRVFFRSVRSECVQLDPGYEATLDAIPDPVRRAQLKRGDWLKKPSRKDYWDRTKVAHVDAAPAKVAARVRAWDLAGSTRNKSPYTTGVQLAMLPSGVLLVEHVLRFRGDPATVHETFTKTAAADAERDPRITQWLPQDPGQAGKDQVRLFQVENPDVRLRWRPVTGDKLTRFGLASARALNGTLHVLRASWNGDLHDELEAVPENEFWDQADALADGVAALTKRTPQEPGKGWAQPHQARSDEDD